MQLANGDKTSNSERFVHHSSNRHPGPTMHSSLNSPRVTVSPTITMTKCAPAKTEGSNTYVPVVVAPIHSTCAATVPQNPSNRNPVRVKALSELLQGYHNAERVVSGFTHGFMLDFKGPETPLSSHNASSVLMNEQVVADKIKKELEMGRITGPFFEQFQMLSLAHS